MQQLKPLIIARLEAAENATQKDGIPALAVDLMIIMSKWFSDIGQQSWVSHEFAEVSSSFSQLISYEAGIPDETPEDHE